VTERILITGATGFVGRSLVVALQQQDVELHLVLREVDEELVSAAKVKSIITTPDLFAESEHWWKEICQQVDVVIHLAWYVEPGEYLESTQNLECLVGSIRLAKGAAAAQVKRFVGVGTSLEYDLRKGYLSIETPLLPITLYARSKVACFLALSGWFTLTDVKFSWCRLFYMYGKNEDPRRLVPYIRSQLEAGLPAQLTSGENVRDFLDVEDVAKIMATLSLGDHEGPVNICSGTPTTVRGLAEKIASEYGRHDLLNFGGKSSGMFDPPLRGWNSELPKPHPKKI
jgi:dTDP-6-deoxy-L-talose 4-dehydrogenase (NAD+)